MARSGYARFEDDLRIEDDLRRIDEKLELLVKSISASNACLERLRLSLFEGFKAVHT